MQTHLHSRQQRNHIWLDFAKWLQATLKYKTTIHNIENFDQNDCATWDQAHFVVFAFYK